VPAREEDGERWRPAPETAHAADAGWLRPHRMLAPEFPPRFPRLEQAIAFLLPGYAVRRARARRQLAAEKIAATLAALNAERPRPPRRSAWLHPTEVDVTPEGYRLPRPRR